MTCLRHRKYHVNTQLVISPHIVINLPSLNLLHFIVHFFVGKIPFHVWGLWLLNMKVRWKKLLSNLFHINRLDIDDLYFKTSQHIQVYCKNIRSSVNFIAVFSFCWYSSESDGFFDWWIILSDCFGKFTTL